IALGGDEVEPAPRAELVVAEADDAPGQDVQAAEVVEQPAVEAELLDRLLDRAKVEHGGSWVGGRCGECLIGTRAGFRGRRRRGSGSPRRANIACGSPGPARRGAWPPPGCRGTAPTGRCTRS